MDTQDKYSSESVLSNRDIEKVFRIQPKRSRRNSIGEEIFDVDE